MSRYVRVTATVQSLDAVAQALTAMEVSFERRATGVMLEGSLECPGEPVELRVAAGVSGAIEDFGFAIEDGRVVLVCGDVDRDLLEQTLLAEVHQRAAAVGVERAVSAVPGVVLVHNED